MTLPSNNYRPFKDAEICFEEMRMLAPYVLKASQVENDHLERMKLITAALIGGSTLVPNRLSGMNAVPLPLGSTYKATILEDVKMYYERIGPLKTDSRILVVGPEDSFQISSADKVSPTVNLVDSIGN